MKSLTLLFSLLIFNLTASAQNGAYLFGQLNNPPGGEVEVTVTFYSAFFSSVTATLTADENGQIPVTWVELPSSQWSSIGATHENCTGGMNTTYFYNDSINPLIDVYLQLEYCVGDEVYGCTNQDAVNYNPSATQDDGSCIYDTEGCATVNINIYCVDTTSIEYEMVIGQDPFCCDNSWDNLCQTIYESIDGPLLQDCDPNSSDTPGCTDPAAYNFNPLATIDDGSCVYPDSCNVNQTIILLSTQNWGNEISWSLSSGDEEIASGGNYANYSSTTHFACLEDGCYTLELMDSFGDGWNGGNITIAVNGNETINTSLYAGSYNYIVFGVNTVECDTLIPIYGCTDPNAANYNPNATIDDGSCVNSEVDNDICEDALPLQEGTYLISNIGAVTNAGIWGDCWAFGNGEGEQSSIWYSFTTPNEPASIFIEATPDGSNTFTDTQFGLFESCGGEMIYCDGNGGPGLFSAFHFECGELEENTEYILMIDGYYGDMGTCFLTYEVETGCDQVSGCTDPTAVNYNANATIDDGSCFFADDCPANLVSFTLNTAMWGEEISWNLLYEGVVIASGDNYESGSSYTQWLCLQDSCYTFEMFDSFGDGWNGATYSFVSYDQSVTFAAGTLSSGSYGTASLGVNTECAEECGELTFDFIPFGDPPLGCVISTLATYTGEDQSGTLAWDFGAGTPTQSGFDWGSGYQYSANGSYQVCATYTTANCTLTYCDTFIATDCGGEISGCTDPNAINYNPNATLNDGSCQYADSCFTNLALLQINTEMWGAEVSWSLFNDGNEVASGDGYGNYNTYNHWICLEDGCYTIELYDSWGDGWNGGSFELSIGNDTILTGTLESGEWGFFDFGINTEGCVSEIYGCTDPEAANYNPFATIDDGSCQYEECPNTLYLTLTGGEDLPDSSYVYWVFFENDQVPAAIGPHFAGDAAHEICAPDACYILGFGPVPNGWEGDYTLTMGGVVLASGAIEGSTSYMSVEVNSELLGCEPDEDIFGCTDPAAVNFNPDATEDDGSCEYEFECGINFTVSPDSTGAQVIWITPSNNIFNAVEVLWDFGDGNTSTDLFPSHTYAGDGPYLLCLTALFQDPGSNDFCSITFCAELTNEMINPPGFQSSGFSINVLNPGSVTDVQEATWMSGLSVWPNPTNHYAQLEFTLQIGENLNITLFDLAGKQVQAMSFAGSAGMNRYEMDVTGLTPGMYLVRLSGQNQQQTTRLVKQ